LVLSEGHYTLEERPNHKHQNKVAFTERKLVITHYETNNIRGYDGRGEFFNVDDKEYKDAKYKICRSNYILVPAFITRKDNKKITDINEQLKLSYDCFMHDAPIMKAETEGFINILKTGDKKTTALDMFHKLSVPFHPDPIVQDEAKWIQEASMGAIAFGDKYEGPAHKTDICSQYPYLMKQVKNRFPIKKGKFIKLDEIPFPIKVGIYKCKITGTGDYHKDKFFRFNKFNKYTNIDIVCAKEKGFTIEIIKEEPNALVYEYEDCIAGSQLFGTYVDMLFDLKQNHGCKYAKEILNVLWGLLCKRKNLRKTIDLNQVSAEIESKYEIDSIRPKGNQLLVEYYDTNDIFESHYARIKPFLLAMGRRLLAQYATKIGETNIVRAHTDGMISKIKPEIEYGNNLGDLKHEGYCEKCVIHHVGKVEGEFKI
jgi:hypothetical protein